MKPLACVVAVLSVAWIASPVTAQERARPADCRSHGDLPVSWKGLAFAAAGDTLAGMELEWPIRLWGLRAPAVRDRDGQETVPGMRARAALEDMLVSGDHRVSCRVLKWNADCQLLAQCSITAEWPTGSKAQAHDLGLRLVEDGWAYAFNLDDVLSWDKDASAKMAHFEALARQARKGLWPYWLGEQ